EVLPDLVCSGPLRACWVAHVGGGCATDTVAAQINRYSFLERDRRQADETDCVVGVRSLPRGYSQACGGDGIYFRAHPGPGGVRSRGPEIDELAGGQWGTQSRRECRSVIDGNSALQVQGHIKRRHAGYRAFSVRESRAEVDAAVRRRRENDSH